MAVEVITTSNVREMNVCLRSFLIFILLISWNLAAEAGYDLLPEDTVEIEINAIEGLQYDRVRFRVDPEASVRLQFNNTDNMPHNLVITTPGDREEVVEAAAEVGLDQEFVPDMPHVLHYTPVLEPDSLFVVTFTAPSDPGVYPYVCTYPGHGVVMYGAMYVGIEDLPDLSEDQHIPPQRRDQREKAVGNLSAGHPYEVALPAVYRTFMPDSSPASIAVGLPEGESYCFDASFSFLRYAWSGGFIDNTEQWTGNGVDFSEILGKIYFRNRVGFPFRLGNPEDVPDVQFHGYRLVEGGYPEFRYSADGINIRELVKPRGEGVGLVRRFEIETDRQNVWFVTGEDPGVNFEASAGTWTDEGLKLSPEEARQFTITMARKSK